MQNLQKFLEQIQSYEMHHFCASNWVQDGPFALNKNFLEKTINIIFIYLLAPFIVQNF